MSLQNHNAMASEKKRQKQITSFFNHFNKSITTPFKQSSQEHQQQHSEETSVESEVDIDHPQAQAHNITVTYRRRKAESIEENSVETSGNCFQRATSQIPLQSDSEPVGETDKQILNHAQPHKLNGTKKVHCQYFLELGQSDFYLSTCNICGLRYSRGHEEDEKIHKSFHKSYIQGFQFKGWQNERVVSNFGADRVILVVDGDPSHYYSKVKEVTSFMERELDLLNAWLLHKRCKVYFYISSNRIVGCLVSEPIKYGYTVLLKVPYPCSDSKTGSDKNTKSFMHKNRDESGWLGDSKTLKSSCFTAMQYGDARLRREKSLHKTQNNVHDCDEGPICDETPVTAVCGVRGLWVSSVNRRKGIASKLLDVMRKTFCIGCILEPSQCAFSHPTNEGKLLAASYCKIRTFLVYNPSKAVDA